MRSLSQKSDLERVCGNELGALLAQLHSETMCGYETLLATVKNVLYTRDVTRHELYVHVELATATLMQRLASQGWPYRDVTNMLRMAVSHDD